MERSDWITLAALAFSAPVLTFIAAVYKLKKEGINNYNVEYLKDTQAFRKDTLDRLNLLENLLDETRKEHQSREQNLLNQVNELENELTVVKLDLQKEKNSRQLAEAALSKHLRECQPE